MTLSALLLSGSIENKKKMNKRKIFILHEGNGSILKTKTLTMIFWVKSSLICSSHQNLAENNVALNTAGLVWCFAHCPSYPYCSFKHWSQFLEIWCNISKVFNNKFPGRKSLPIGNNYPRLNTWFFNIVSGTEPKILIQRTPWRIKCSPYLIPPPLLMRHDHGSTLLRFVLILSEVDLFHAVPPVWDELLLFDLCGGRLTSGPWWTPSSPPSGCANPSAGSRTPKYSQ